MKQAEQTETTNMEVATEAQATEETTEEVVETKETEKKQEVDVQALLTDLAKTKRALDKASSEAAAYKKQYKETLSEKEQYDLEAAEAQAAHDEEFERMKKELSLSKLREQYVSLGYSKEQASAAANAQYDNDIQTLLKLQKQFTDERIEQEKQKIYAEMPQPNVGVSGTQTYTKEQFDKMDMLERTKLRRDNEAEYNRLLKL